MSTFAVATPEVSTGIAAQPVSTRITSIDIFRGFTMAVMIFVNDVGDVRGLPWWTYHVPRNLNAMSYVDMVFPFFLFAVGLSLPLAVRQRLRRDASLPGLWAHILLRAGALILLGLVLANSDRGSRVLMHMRPSLWIILTLTGAIILWGVYPRSFSARKLLLIRGIGAALFVTMLALYRSTDRAGHVTWFNFRYPEILGLIGLTYISVCLLYVPFRRFRLAPAVLFSLLLLFNVACVANWTSIDRSASLYAFPLNNGAWAAMTMAGVLVSALFLGEHAPSSPRRRFTVALGFAFFCIAAGLLLRPLGISKIRATPTWTLWSVAAATTVFCFFYWLCDRRGHTGWAAPLRPAGSNTLLAYLTPYIVSAGMARAGFFAVYNRWSTGSVGITRSIVFTGAILGVVALLTRARVRLQL